MGEGVGGFFTTLYGRGAAGNGGGGGNSFGSGGGGGGNAGNAAKWIGAGVMNLNFTNDMLAWSLDPEATMAMGRTNSDGGGRGGYTQATVTQDPTKVAPGTGSWGGNLREDNGGRGGSPVPDNAAVQLFLGGGGGAGSPTANVGLTSMGGTGGIGGGIIYLLANQVDGSGSIVANGAQGTDLTYPTDTNGPGGGGAGGTVVVNATTLTGSLSISANGGGGGSQLVLNPNMTPLTTEAEGPGGGGGGGFIAVPAGIPNTIIQSATGGRGGITDSDLVTPFPSNGATDGKAGLTGQGLNPQSAPTPICAPVDLQVSIASSSSFGAQGSLITYTVTVYNNGPFTATAAPLTSVTTPTQANSTWTCTAVGPNQDVNPATCGSAQGTGDLNTTVSLPAGATATLVYSVPVNATMVGPLQYQVTVMPPSGVNDTDLSNNTATVTTTIGPEADLEVSATVAPNPVQSGEPVTFIISVNNNGPNVANNVVLTFDVPQNSVLQGSAVGSGWTCAPNASSMLLTCTLPMLAPGPGTDITIPVLPNFGDTEALGSAQVSSDSVDPNLSNNSATAIDNINYNPAGYMQPVLAGGGFGCTQSGTSGSSGFGMLSALAAVVLLLTRRRVGCQS
jgi:uncharacterized repeat protein (TIGR01451 family)